MSILAIIAFALPAPAGCVRTVSYPCEAIRLQIPGEHYILSSDAGDACSASPPKEMLVPGTGYEVYLLSRAGSEPKIYLGVVSDAGWRLVADQALTQLPPKHSIDKRATHWTRRTLLPDSVLRLTVQNEMSGQEVVHEYELDTAACICRIHEML